MKPYEVTFRASLIVTVVAADEKAAIEKAKTIARHENDQWSDVWGIADSNMIIWTDDVIGIEQLEED